MGRIVRQWLRHGVACGTRRITDERSTMSKRARKRRSRKGSKANHGRRPNA